MKNNYAKLIFALKKGIYLSVFVLFLLTVSDWLEYRHFPYWPVFITIPCLSISGLVINEMLKSKASTETRAQTPLICSTGKSDISEKVMFLLKSGKKIEAIREYRKESGNSLRAAVKIIDDAYDRKHYYDGSNL